MTLKLNKKQKAELDNALASTEGEINKAMMAFNDFVAYSQDRAFVLGIMKDEDFVEFVKEHYILGFDKESDVYVLIRAKDNKKLIKYQLVESFENGELKSNMIIMRSDEDDADPNREK